MSSKKYIQQRPKLLLFLTVVIPTFANAGVWGLPARRKLLNEQSCTILIKT